MNPACLVTASILSIIAFMSNPKRLPRIQRVYCIQSMLKKRSCIVDYVSTLASLFFEVNDVHKTNFPESLSLSCEDESVKFLSCLIKTTKILIEKDLWIVL